MSRALAERAAMRYTFAMRTRLAAILCLLVAGLALGGCTNCGWLWDDARACHADAPRALASGH